MRGGVNGPGAEEIMKKIDTDGNGEISLTEHKTALKNRPAPPPAEKLTSSSPAATGHTGGFFFYRHRK